MVTIKRYELFSEEKKVNDIINYIDYSINESIDIGKLWSETVNKVKNLSDSSKKKVLNHIIVTLLLFNTSVNVTNLINKSDVDFDTKKIALSIIDNSEEKSESKWKNGYDFSISEKGIDHIKDEETLRLKAYSIGDWMITIGWGHAERENRSSYSVGQKISEGDANELLDMDLKTISDGVRRIFKEWESDDIDVKITQDMFDALVSIAFNTGVGGLRKSELLKDIKSGNYDSAGEKIKTFKVSKKFPGLANRREKESEMFLASL